MAEPESLLGEIYFRFVSTERGDERRRTTGEL